MELNAEQRMLPVGNSHDLAVTAGLFGPSRYLKFARQSIRLNHQTMVPRRLEWIVQTCKQMFTIVVDHIRLAVHEVFRSNDRGAERLPHRLMAETHSQKRQPAFQSLAALNGNASLGRRA